MAVKKKKKRAVPTPEVAPKGKGKGKGKPQRSVASVAAPIVDAFERWKSGTPFTTLLKELDLTWQDLRRPFKELAGGQDAFNMLKKTPGVGGAGVFFGGKRGGSRTKEQRVADDKDVPKVHSITRKKGWTWQNVFRPIVVRISEKDSGRKGEPQAFAWRELVYRVYTSPKGNSYVEAQPAEKADLICVAKQNAPKRDVFGKAVPGQFWDHSSIPNLRLRRLERSSKAQRALRAVKEHDDGIKRHEKRRKAKKLKQKKLNKLKLAHAK